MPKKSPASAAVRRSKPSPRRLSPRRLSPRQCKSALRRKIRVNLREQKRSPKQAIAVAYAQARKLSGCKRVLGSRS